MHVRGVRVIVLAAALTAAIVAGPTAAQQAGIVRGRVEIGQVNTRRPASAYPSRTVPQVQLAPASEVRHVVVYVKDAPARQISPVKVAIRQQSENFIPRVVAVPVGSEVEFPNDDPIYHNVFSLSRAKDFNLGRYPRGHSKSVRFDRPGIVKVFCEIHSHMTATVMVFNHPWFAIPGEDGRFELPAVPAGRHEIIAWHERLGESGPKAVTVESGRPAEADFVLPVPRQ
jgi:plastocyanin